MDLLALPQCLLFEVYLYLKAHETLSTVAVLSSAYRLSVREYIHECKALKARYFGAACFRRDYDRCEFQRLLHLASVSLPRVLAMRATYTDGGVIEDDAKYWVQNMFEYCGSTYTSNQIAKNVTVRCAFAGTEFRLPFTFCQHDDLYCWENLRSMIPAKYVSNFIPSDLFLTGRPQRRAADYSAEELRDMSREEREIDREFTISVERNVVYRVEVPEPPRAALITHVAIARPGFFTCPLRTILVLTKLSSSALDLSEYYGLDSLDAVQQCTRLPPVVAKREAEDYVSVEFDGSSGAALWVQFRSTATAQVEVCLQRPRFLLYAEALLIDMDDRRSDYQVTDVGIDVSFLAFAGVPVPLKCLLLQQDNE